MEFVTNILELFITNDIYKKSLLIYLVYSRFIKSNFILHRGHLIDKPRKVKLPPQIIEKHKELTNEELNEKKFDERIIYFKRRLREKLTDEQRILFNNNVKELNIKKTVKSRISRFLKKNNIPLYKIFVEIGGKYIPQNNSIVLYNDELEIVIFHELIHMASCAKKNNGFCLGFVQDSYPSMLGNGINEGTTQYLTEKFFPEKIEKHALIYTFETQVVKSLVKIIGDDALINNFFMANLDGLIDEISKYVSRDEAVKFIEHLDTVNGFFYNNNKFLIKRKSTVQNSIYYINNFLAKMYSIKLVRDKNYTDDIRVSLLTKFLSELNDNIFYDRFNYLPFEDINYDEESEKKIR